MRWVLPLGLAATLPIAAMGAVDPLGRAVFGAHVAALWLATVLRFLGRAEKGGK